MQTHPTRPGPLQPTTDSNKCQAAPVDDFIQRLSEQVAAADEQVRELRDSAQVAFHSRQKRLTAFVEAADHIYECILSRLAALRSFSVFADAIQHNRPEPGVASEQERHHRTASLTLPPSDKRPKSMKLSFRIGPDGPAERIVIDYQLVLLPIFFAFEDHDQLSGLVGELRDEAVSEWIEEKLLGFTQTYFKVFFHEQYQRDSLVTDPVLQIRFPASMASATHDSAGTACYFYTNESAEEFRANPEVYI